MLSGLLITLNILVCIALIGVVLLQRSEGGAFGMGGAANRETVMVPRPVALTVIEPTAEVLPALRVAVPVSLIEDAVSVTTGSTRTGSTELEAGDAELAPIAFEATTLKS